MKRVERVFTVVGSGMNYIAILALIVMVAITILDVLLKNLFKAPVTGANEITRMMMVCMAPSFVSVLMNNRHVSVGLIVDNLSRKAQIAFDVCGYLLSAGLCGLMFYQGVVVTMRRIAEKQVYTMLKIPTWPFYLLFAISMGVFSVAIIAKLYLNIADKGHYSKPAEGHERQAEAGAPGAVEPDGRNENV